MIKISTSILSSNKRQLSICTLNKTNTDYIHIDVMDNEFVNNYQFPIEEINKLIPHSKKPLDIHLMVNNPEIYIENINNHLINNITIHIEINKDISKLLKLIKSYGYKAGLAINPKTDINLIDKYIKDVDIILVMSVEPGLGGQKFIKNTVNKTKEIKKKYPDTTIEVDGGINNETIKLINNITDIAVSGSYIINSNNYKEAINNLKK